VNSALLYTAVVFGAAVGVAAVAAVVFGLWHRFHPTIGVGTDHDRLPADLIRSASQRSKVAS
jgi:hypothetical protein